MEHNTILAAFVFCLVAYAPAVLYGQTCCSGGVPLANNIGGLPPADKGVLQLSLNLDANYLKTLKDGETLLEDRSRSRTTYSLLLKSAYTLSNRLTLEALFSAIRQERSISQGGFEDFTQTKGLGDAVVMAYYTYLRKNNWELTAGAGPKIPVGPSDLKNDNGITLNADLQPGSGAWDGIFHHRVVMKLTARPSLAFNNYITYRLTGVNPDYLGSQRYEFGNEFQFVLGAIEQQAIGRQLFAYGLNFRYRHAMQDKNNGQWLPNTGGAWVFIMPVLSWYFTPQLALTVNGEVPVYSQVQGTQLTPTYRFNLGLYMSINTVKNDLINFK